MATVQDLLSKKVIRKVTRSDKGSKHRRQGYGAAEKTNKPKMPYMNSTVVKGQM